LEAAGPGKALPSKQVLLDFQARWMRPAGVSAIVGALIFAVSLPLQQAGAGDNDAERLTKFHEHSTQVFLSQGPLVAIPFLLFIPVLYVLIRSAAGRTRRVPNGMVVLAFIGPILFAISSFLLAAGLNDVSGKFVDQAPAKERQAREQAAAAEAAAATGASGKQSQPAKGKATTATTATRPTTSTSGSTTTTPQVATPAPKTPEEAASQARDDLASHLIDHTALLQAGSLVRFAGLATLVFGLIYIPLWATRTGLLSRFWSTIGMAFAVSLILVPFGILGVVLWFAILGLMLARWWPRPLPPAWDAGEAIPWPSGPGGGIGPPPEERGASGTVEGSGREVSEERLPENDSGQAPDQGETQGQRRKKRKRRN
jgi:hypothetical protein